MLCSGNGAQAGNTHWSVQRAEMLVNSLSVVLRLGGGERVVRRHPLPWLSAGADPSITRPSAPGSPSSVLVLLQFMGFILLMDAVRRSRVSNGLCFF